MPWQFKVQYIKMILIKQLKWKKSRWYNHMLMVKRMQ